MRTQRNAQRDGKCFPTSGGKRQPLQQNPTSKNGSNKTNRSWHLHVVAFCLFSYVFPWFVMCLKDARTQHVCTQRLEPDWWSMADCNAFYFVVANCVCASTHLRVAAVAIPRPDRLWKTCLQAFFMTRKCKEKNNSLKTCVPWFLLLFPFHLGQFWCTAAAICVKLYTAGLTVFAPPPLPSPACLV